ncbi:MAG TPA: hypothetical protein VE978_21945 [Chitinophagales bacterium]|nr:hypothetical protein [Chitinophagales bacterium]
MTKDQIKKIRIEILCDGQPALQLFLHKDGTMERYGSGSIPIKEDFVLGLIDKKIFEQLLSNFDEKLLDNQGIYDHNDKAGIPINYSLIFLGQEPNFISYEFRLGTETKKVTPLLTYIDKFVNDAVSLTDEWYKK